MLEPVFKPYLNFDGLVERLATHKVAFEPQALAWDFVQELAAEIGQGSFDPVESSGKVCEDYGKYKLVGVDNFSPRVAQLVDTLTWGIRLGCGKHGLYLDWYPNDLEIHRYRPGDVAITSHRDFSNNKDLVAIVTVTGFASFYIHGETRDGNPRRYHTGPGSLALVDISQFHAVDPPISGERLVVVMWMNRDLQCRPGQQA